MSNRIIFLFDGGTCRWVDLLWDRHHPGALQLLARLSARLSVQTGATAEELWLKGDPEARAVLERVGFTEMPEPRGLVTVARAFHPDFDVRRSEPGDHAELEGLHPALVDVQAVLHTPDVGLDERDPHARSATGSAPGDRPSVMPCLAWISFRDTTFDNR